MSNTRLAIYLGESYAELELRAIKDKNSAKKTNTSLFKKAFFLPQTSLKAMLAQVKQSLPENSSIDQVFVVTKYLDRLKSFRLGGSVVQVLNENYENNYVFQNSSCLSLAASALIIPLTRRFDKNDLQKELDRIRKVNPEAKKVVLSLNDFSQAQITTVEDFFKANEFTVFINKYPNSTDKLRRCLINAGAEGTKEEILSEIKEIAPSSQIHIWVNKQFTPVFENIDLFFSADNFLNHALTLNQKDILIHTDLERWIIMKNEYQQTWHSPWGDVEYPHIVTHPIGIHPFSEVLINGSGHLSFSTVPVAIEPGPMLAGRSVKPLIVDAFFDVISQDKTMTQMFTQLVQSNISQKITSQFKVLEKGQAHYDEPLNLDIIQDFIINKLGYDILLFKLKEEELEWTGHLNILFERLNGTPQNFSWTEEIFQRLNDHV